MISPNGRKIGILPAAEGGGCNSHPLVQIRPPAANAPVLATEKRQGIVITKHRVRISENKCVHLRDATRRGGPSGTARRGRGRNDAGSTKYEIT